MSAEQNKELIKKFFNEGMNHHDFSVADLVIGDSYVNHSFQNTKRGKEGFQEVMQQFLGSFPDMQINVEEVIAEGDSVATRGSWKGTHTGDFMGILPTGKTVQVSYMDFWKFKDGKASENWVEMNMISLMQQLGAMPSK